MSEGPGRTPGLGRVLESLGDVYEALYSVRKLGFYRILRELIRLGVRRRTAALQKLRTIAKLHEEEVKLRADYHLHLMRLGLATVYVPKIVECSKLPPTVPFLRSCINLLPTGTLLTFYYPESFKPKRLEGVGAQVYPLYERLFNRSDISSYAAEIAENPESLLSPRRVREHVVRRLGRLNEERLSLLEAEVFGRELKVRIDNKDLLVLRSLELNPLTTESMEVKLGMKRGMYEKHLEHAERLLRGLRIRSIHSLASRARIALVASIFGDPKGVLGMLDSLLSYPLTASTVASKDLKLLMAQLLLPPDLDVVRDVAITLREVSREHGLEVANYFMGDLKTLVNFHVPHVRDVEYSPSRRNWLENSLRLAFKYVKKE